MDRQVSPNGAVIYQRSHDLVLFRSGRALEEDVEGPMCFALDEETRDGELPTLFTTPGLVTTRAFAQDLQQAGVDNLQIYPARIEDPVDGTCNEDYVFINVIGLASCADMEKSKVRRLGSKMVLLDDVVLDSARIPDMGLFRLAEDHRILIISDHVYTHLQQHDYPDVFFEELPQA